MSYILVGILFLLIASGFLAYLVLTATRRSSPAREDDVSVGIGSDDESPFGDTSEHAGDDRGGHGAGGADADGGEGSHPPPGRFQRDPVGGEAEARPFTR